MAAVECALQVAPRAAVACWAVRIPRDHPQTGVVPPAKVDSNVSSTAENSSQSISYTYDTFHSISNTWFFCLYSLHNLNFVHCYEMKVLIGNV